VWGFTWPSKACSFFMETQGEAEKLQGLFCFWLHPQLVKSFSQKGSVKLFCVPLGNGP